MSSNTLDEQDRANQLVKLRVALSNTRLGASHAEEIHHQLVCFYDMRKIRGFLAGTPPSQVFEDAVLASERSKALAKWMSFKELSGTQSPHVWELLESKFTEHMLSIGGSLPPRHVWAQSDNLPVRWASWRMRLSADLRLLKVITGRVRKELEASSTLPEDAAASLKEELILKVDQALRAVRPHDKPVGSWLELVADVVSIYEPHLDCTVDSIKGVFRKHGLKIKSR